MYVLSINLRNFFYYVWAPNNILKGRYSPPVLPRYNIFLNHWYMLKHKSEIIYKERLIDLAEKPNAYLRLVGHFLHILLCPSLFWACQLLRFYNIFSYQYRWRASAMPHAHQKIILHISQKGLPEQTNFFFFSGKFQMLINVAYGKDTIIVEVLEKWNKAK